MLGFAGLTGTACMILAAGAVDTVAVLVGLLYGAWYRVSVYTTVLVLPHVNLSTVSGLSACPNR